MPDAGHTRRPARARTHARCAVLGVVVMTLGGAAGASSLLDRPSADPAGRGLHLLRDRESILEVQANLAERTARERGRLLYRLLLLGAAERVAGVERGEARAQDGPAGRSGGRAISLAVAVLDRDLREAAVLRAELARVRQEREAAASSAADQAPTGATPPPAPAGEPPPAASASPPDHSPVFPPPPRMLAPVPGPPVLPFGVARDDSTGAWIFRAAAGFATKPKQPVRATADGRVKRIESDGADGLAVVLSHAGGWTSVLSGLGAVVVSPRDGVGRGGLIGFAPGAGGSGIVRVEVWRGRQPMDPVTLLRSP